MNLIDKFKESFKTNLAAPSCIVNGKVMNRLDFKNLVALASQNLHRMGVKEGDVIGLALPHAPLHLATIVAIARLGAISLPLNPFMPSETRAALLEKIKANFIVTTNSTDPAADQMNVPLIAAAELVKPVGGAPDLDFISYNPAKDLPARLNLTSGSTGIPNAICYTHEHWVERIERTSVGYDMNSRIVPGPLNLTLGNISALAVLFQGGSVVFHNLREPNALWQAIWLHSVTHMIATPADLRDITSQIAVEGLAFPSLKQIRVVGGSVPSRLMDLVQKNISPNVYIAYGATEVGLISWADSSLLKKFPGSSGRIREGVELQAVSPDGKVLPVGELGELRVKIVGMPNSYYMNPIRSKEKFRDEWFYTGDMGTVDENGNVYLHGRTDMRLNVAGIKFFPEDVEKILLAHPSVNDAAVFTFKNKNEDEDHLIAVVVPQSDQIPPADLGRYCHEQRLGFLTPEKFLLVNQLPKNASGKLDRLNLSKVFESLL